MSRRLVIIFAGTVVFFALTNLLGHKLLLYGLKEYYCLYPADILVIGHSMSEMAIDKRKLESGMGYTVAKYCMNGAGIADRLVMIKHYIEATGHTPKMVLYDVSGRSFSGGLSTNSYSLFYPFMNESKAVSEYLHQGALRRDYWRKKLIPLTRYDDTRLGAVVRGYRHDWKNRKLNQFDAPAFRKALNDGRFWKIGFDQDNMRLFQETLDFLEKEGIQCILLALPCVDMLNQAEPDKYNQAMDFIQEQVRVHDGVSFLDFNPEFSSRYELFADPIHMNPKGQREITAKLGQLLGK